VKPVLIRWADARGYDGWADIEDMKASGLAIVDSAGFIVHEDEDHVCLVSHIIEDSGTGAGHISIPKCGILDIKYLVSEQ